MHVHTCTHPHPHPHTHTHTHTPTPTPTPTHTHTCSHSLLLVPLLHQHPLAVQHLLSGLLGRIQPPTSNRGCPARTEWRRWNNERCYPPVPQHMVLPLPSHGTWCCPSRPTAQGAAPPVPRHRMLPLPSHGTGCCPSRPTAQGAAPPVPRHRMVC